MRRRDAVKAFNNVCSHRQSQVVTGCGKAKRFTCPYHAWTYDDSGRLVGLPGREGFPGVEVKSDGLTELSATEFAGFLWAALDPAAPLDIAAHLGPLAEELDSWGIGRWSPLGEKVLDTPITWKLAVDTFSENYHFATVHIVPSVSIANGELFRIYPGEMPGRSVTVHQNSTPLDISEESVAAGAEAVFDYAHAAVRDEDYRLVQGLQANLESGARDHLLFGRNEPGLQHRHNSWASWTRASRSSAIQR